MSNQKAERSRTQPDGTTVTWHALSTDQVLETLDTQFQSGLTSQEAARRLEQYGPNQLTEKPRPGFLQLVLDQLKSFVVILLIVAAVISAVLGEWVDASAIIAIVVLNAILGVVQESRAEQALAALKKLAAPEAQILRDGHRVSITAGQLVPGDIVFLEAGNFIPADVRLIEAMNLRVEEASLTGESVPVQKNATLTLDKDIPLGDRKNTAFMGTVVSYGRGRGVVVSTGMRTQLGLIAGMLQLVENEETPLQRRLDQLGKTLGWASLIICALVFLVGWWRGEAPVLELFMTSVSLAIAAVPEGLPAIVTISLALGMREMIHRHALIRKLSSVETLGSATVICSDKTGTLTQNEMTVTRIWADGEMFDITGNGYNPQGEFRLKGSKIDTTNYPAVRTALWVGTLNNDAQIETTNNDNGELAYRIVGDPTEGSILVAAAKAGAIQEDLNQAYPRENEIPFDSVRKRMVTIHAVKAPSAEDISPFQEKPNQTWYTVAIKGAPDVVLNLCSQVQSMDSQSTRPMDEEARKQILSANDAMTRDALRVLGVAYRLVPVQLEEVNSEALEKDLIFVGLIGMIDPARPEVKPALEKARAAGIRTIMITGDYPNTARAIAENISLLIPGHQVLTGNDLNGMSDAELYKAVEVTDVFARVSPEHKMRIVDALKANGEITAMTGDGVNDAPAIKRADIGISMGITGTDVAKETADMV
ncbi:MAG: HAD-IC family P-type ATPase, partial [Anaerolineaceae bacterium]|nr:HAD-IC family P-type ATPase [Anaerolineaceae bacterium]